MNQNKIFILILLFFSFILIACVQESIECQGKTYLVSRVIDGDTIETTTGKKIRLTGINTPEKKEACFEEAKEFTEKTLLGKRIELQEEGTDIYDRILGKICIEGKSFNKKLIETGLAHYYSYEKIPELEKLQEKAMQEKKGCLWREGNEKYIQDKCIKLEKLEFNQNNVLSGEFAEFSNDCNYAIDLNGFYLKDEATNLYFFPEITLKEKSFIRIYSGKGTDSGNELYMGKGNIWNNDKDQLFLRNEKGILVAYQKYTNNLN